LTRLLFEQQELPLRLKKIYCLRDALGQNCANTLSGGHREQARWGPPAYRRSPKDGQPGVSGVPQFTEAGLLRRRS